MTYEKLFDKELMILGGDFKDKGDLFREVSKDLYDKEFVNETYYDALTQREEEYPTGLETIHGKIAIPHTDVAHVKKPFIYMVQLNQEISFNNMGDTSQVFDVNVVLFLGIKEPQEQIKLLSKLMENFMDQKFIDIILEEKDKEKLEEKLNQFI